MAKSLVTLLLLNNLIFVVTALFTYKILSEEDLYAKFNFRSSNNVVPHHYDINLMLNEISHENDIVHGESTIKIQVFEETNNISLHYTGVILKVTLFNDDDNSVIMPREHYMKETQTINFHFENAILPGYYKLFIKYIGSPKPRNFFKIPYFTSNESESWIIYTMFQPNGARHVFPCWDEPGKKATFRLSVDHDQNHKVFSNTMIEATYGLENGISCTHFERTSEMDAYHLAIIIVPLEWVITYVPKINTIIWHRAQMKSIMDFAYDTVDPVKTYLSMYMYSNMHYKLNYVIIPSSHKESIINPGLIVYRENAINYNRDISLSLAQKFDVTRLVVRTLANFWFQNMVSPSWWTDLWLNEALAAFFQMKFIVTHDLMTLFLVHIQHECLFSDNWYNMEALSSLKSLESYSLFTLSIKAPAIFYMLEQAVTPPVFHNGLLKYLQTYKLKNATSDHLWDNIQSVLDKSRTVKHPDIQLKTVMHSWVKQSNYPIVTVKRNSEDEIIIRQQVDEFDVFQDAFANQKWWIPITYTVRKECNFFNTTPRAWLQPLLHSHITIDPIRKNDWIIVNIQQTGYYRVNYESWNWQLIANYLNSEEYTNIHVLNRAKIIDDAYFFMMIGQLDHNIFLNLTRYLSREINYAAWYPMFKIFEYLSNFLPFQESDFLQAHMKTILDFVLVKIGFIEQQYDDILTKCLRQEALKWACTLNSRTCKIAAYITLQRHFKHPEKQKFSWPHWKDWTYCNSLLAENSRTYMEMKTYLTNTNISKHKMLEYFLCIKKSNYIYTFLKAILNDYTMKSNERINVFYSIIKKAAQDNLDVILKHFQKYGIFHDKVKTLSILINHVYSYQHLLKIKRYVERNFHNDNIMQLKIRKMLDLRLEHIIRHLKQFSKLFAIDISFLDKYNIIEWRKPPSNDHHVTSNDVTPLHYNIEMKILDYIDESGLAIEGNLNYNIMIHREINKMKMHFSNHESLSNIDSIFLVDEMNNLIILSISFFIRRNNIILEFDKVLSPGNYILYMKAKNIINETDGNFLENSCTEDENKNKIWSGALYFKPFENSQIFPYWESRLKTTFNISIHHHKMHTVLSNMPAQSVTHVNNSKDYVISHFFTTPPIAAESFAIVILPKSAYDNKIYQENNIWCKPYLTPYVEYIKYDADRLKIFLNVYIGYLTEFKNISKINHLITRNIQNDFSGTFGLIIYNEAAVIYDKELHSTGRKIQTIYLIAHAVAHQWFSEVIRSSKWTNLWLNYGLIKFFANKAINQFATEGHISNLLTQLIRHESLHLDTNGFMDPLSVKLTQSKTAMSFPMNIKAPTIIHMLQYIISNNIYEFMFIIRQYFNIHRYQITRKDLWTIMEKNIHSTQFHTNNHTNSTYDTPKLKYLMYAWIKEMHYPVLKVVRNYDIGTVQILQENFNILDNTKWWIPVTYTTQTELNFTNTLPKLWLNPGVENETLVETVQKDNWIIANLKQTGYYRVNYDRLNWQLIINYLNSEDYSKIDVLNRAQIIDDAYHLMMTLQLDHNIFLNLINYLSQETDYIAWYPMLKIFEYISPFLPFQESTSLKVRILKILNSALANLKYEDSEDEDILIKCLRQEIVRWACTFGDSYCREIANVKLIEHLKDPEQNKLSPDWKEWTFCNGLKTASKITWLKFWNTYSKLSNNRIFHIISCSGGFANPNLQLDIKTLDHIASRRYECINLLYFVVTMNEENDLKIILPNLKDYISDCSSNDSRDMIKVLTIIINHAYFKHQLHTIKQFVQNNIQQQQDIMHMLHLIKARQYYIKNHKLTFSIYRN